MLSSFNTISLFLTLDRARAAVTQIGPAVLNGGISTFLAFCLLAGSESYAFQTFFKVSVTNVVVLY